MILEGKKMAYQFMCPQGHLLEGDASQAGQPCQCPTCGMDFIVPEAAPSLTPEISPDSAFDPLAAAPLPPQDTFAPVHSATLGVPNMGNPDPAGAGVPFDPLGTEAATKVLHIPCPNGHLLDTPADMLGEVVVCPHCNEQFALREKDSVEFKRKKQRQEEQEAYKSGKKWLTWAIVIVAIVAISLIAMIVLGQQ